MFFSPLHFFLNDVKHGDYIAKTAMDNVISTVQSTLLQERWANPCTSTFPYVTEINRTSSCSGSDANANSIASTSSQPWFVQPMLALRMLCGNACVHTGSVSMMILSLTIFEKNTQYRCQIWTVTNVPSCLNGWRWRFDAWRDLVCKTVAHPWRPKSKKNPTQPWFLRTKLRKFFFELRWF